MCESHRRRRRATRGAGKLKRNHAEDELEEDNEDEFELAAVETSLGYADDPA